MTTWQQVNVYVKHTVAVALSTAVALGILDPATNAVHVNAGHSLELVALTTGLSLLSSYAGLGAPTKGVQNGTPDIAYVDNPDNQISHG